MLVLSRKLHEKILFPGIDAAIQVVGVKGNIVRLGIEAPADVVVLREELRSQAPANAARPARPDPESVMRELRHFLQNRFNGLTVGLALLRRQRQAGLEDQVEATLERIDHELEKLRQRVGAAVDQPAAKPAAAKPRKPRKALLVEDDQNERELLASFLRLAGLDVDTAGDGVDALDYLHTRGKPDVVLLDMALPRCDGAATVRAIRQDPAIADLKIFAVSGRTPGQVGLDGGRGVDRWFQKPLNAEVLLHDLTEDVAGEP